MEWLREMIDRFFVETNRLLYGWRYEFGQFWGAGWNREFLIALAALLGLIVAFIVIGRNRRKDLSLFEKVSRGLANAPAPEALSSLFFEVLFRATRAPAAAFYLAHSPEGPFVLKGKRSNPDFASNAAEEWEPTAVLEELLNEPSTTKKGSFFIFSFPVTLGDGRAAVVSLVWTRSQDATRIKARVPFIGMLSVPVLSQLASLDRIQQLEEQTRESSAVVSSSQILLSATLGPEQLADLLLDLAVRSTESDAGLILASDPAPGEGRPLILASRGLGSLLPQELTAALQKRGFAFPGESAVIHPWDATSDFYGSMANAGFRSLAQAPIAIDGETLGSVMLLKRNKTFDPSHLRVCQLNSSRLAFTFKNRRYHEEVFTEYKETLKALVHTTESSASHLTGHSLRVAWIAGALARDLALPDAEAQGIELAGELHDVGMVGLSEEILLKPGKLTSQEYDLVKHHPMVGAALTAPVRLPIPIGPLILHHHERHDGFGYPGGLRGEAVPLGARIIALGEVFDAMVSSRTYRKALPIAEALEKLRSLAGTQLDPLVVERFIGLMNGAQRPAFYGE